MQCLKSLGYVVEVRGMSLPDDDFAHMCNAKTFVQTGGGFSSLIAEVVKKRGNLVIS
jgi:hypothetical protein